MCPALTTLPPALAARTSGDGAGDRSSRTSGRSTPGATCRSTGPLGRATGGPHDRVRSGAPASRAPAEPLTASGSEAPPPTAPRDSPLNVAVSAPQLERTARPGAPASTRGRPGALSSPIATAGGVEPLAAAAAPLAATTSSRNERERTGRGRLTWPPGLTTSGGVRPPGNSSATCTGYR